MFKKERILQEENNKLKEEIQDFNYWISYYKNIIKDKYRINCILRDENKKLDKETEQLKKEIDKIYSGCCDCCQYLNVRELKIEELKKEIEQLNNKLENTITNNSNDYLTTLQNEIDTQNDKIITLLEENRVLHEKNIELKERISVISWHNNKLISKYESL